MSMAVLTRGLSWTKEEVDDFLDDVRKDTKNRNIHAYIDVFAISNGGTGNTTVYVFLEGVKRQ